MVLVATLLAAPADARAEESLLATGSLTYIWHGDPARGCDAEGLCGVDGAVIVESQGQADASSFRGSTNINVFPSATTVRVVDGESGTSAECVDTPLNGPGELLVGRRDGRLQAQVEPPISSGRCAGPLPQDLAGLRLDVRKTDGRRPSFDLRGSQPFVAGPFSGTLVSTLVLKPGSLGGSETSSSSGSFLGPPPPRKQLIEQVTLRYRVSSLPGALETSFSGEPDPFCVALDSCGATGTLGLSLLQLNSHVVLDASRVVPARVSARRAIADLRRGRLRLRGIAGVGAGTLATESVSGGDGLRCQDSSTGSQAQLQFVPQGPRRGDGVEVTLFEGFGSVALRTHCPGPADTDVFGSLDRGIAGGAISLTNLLRRQSVVSLTNPGAFSGFGYAGSRAGAIGLSLALGQIHAGTISVERP